MSSAHPPLLDVSREAVEAFAEDVALLWCGGSGNNTTTADISILESPPSPAIFLRDYVARSRPCLIRNALTPSTSHATSILSSLDDMVESYPDLILTVDVTPDGHGDSLRYVTMPASASTTIDTGTNSNAIRTITGATGTETTQPTTGTGSGSGAGTVSTKVFVQPAQETMTLAEFRRKLRRQSQSSSSDQLASRRIRNRHFAVNNDSSDTPHGDSHKISGIANSIESLVVEKESPFAASDNDDTPVVYYSRQNDCLRTELAPIWNNQCGIHTATTKCDSSDIERDGGMIPDSFAWAELAFGTSEPDAINLWMGNARSVSSMHKDPYENLYAVVAGQKVFTLCPPCDAPFLYEQPPRYRSGRFTQPRRYRGNTADMSDAETIRATCTKDSCWEVRLDDAESTGSNSQTLLLPWVSADVTCRDDADVTTEYPLISFAHPLTVHVAAGDLLYLPALWYHRVTQTCETIAVNYWYPMIFESPLWCYYSLLQQLRPVAPAPSRPETDTALLCDEEKEEVETRLVEKA